MKLTPRPRLFTPSRNDLSTAILLAAAMLASAVDTGCKIRREPAREQGTQDTHIFDRRAVTRRRVSRRVTDPETETKAMGLRGRRASVPRNLCTHHWSLVPVIRHRPLSSPIALILSPACDMSHQPLPQLWCKVRCRRNRGTAFVAPSSPDTARYLAIDLVPIPRNKCRIMPSGLHSRQESSQLPVWGRQIRRCLAATGLRQTAG
jgi:hypothetical protein